jgi:hypothetical protein
MKTTVEISADLYRRATAEAAVVKDGHGRTNPTPFMRVEPRPTLRFAIGFCLAAAALLPLGFAHAQTDPAADSLRLYAVNIVQDPPQPWPGYGIYLGKGLVITAQHVVGSAARTKPSVRIADMDLPAHAIR